MQIDKNEAITSALKSVFGAVPFVGNLLSEVLFDYRSRIKQERLNQFTHLLSEYFNACPNVSEESIRNEQFSDLFESVLRRVMQTSSIEKQKRFKEVLINQIVNPESSIQAADIYLDLINSLDERQILILQKHKQTLAAQKQFEVDCEVKEKQIKKDQFHNHITVQEALKRKKTLQVSMEEYKFIEANQSEFYGIAEQRFFYYKQTLFARGLLAEDRFFKKSFPHHSFEVMRITNFGIEFLDFIRDEAEAIT